MTMCTILIHANAALAEAARHSFVQHRANVSMTVQGAGNLSPLPVVKADITGGKVCQGLVARRAGC
jgi:hypothetical protein